MNPLDGELNPNHPVTTELRSQWYKLAAILIFKQGLKRVDITAEDIQNLADSGYGNITMRPHGNTITLALVSDKEARELARKEGGLPS